jgi:hypothetical protein
LFLFVSSRKNNTINVSIKANIVINQKGAFIENGKSREPSIGQIINHIQKSAQIIPIFCILSCFVLDISDNIDCKTLIFPQVNQFIILATRKTIKISLKLISKFAIKVQTTHKIKTILLPYLSDNCPKIGDAKNEKNAYKTIA